MVDPSIFTPLLSPLLGIVRLLKDVRTEERKISQEKEKAKQEEKERIYKRVVEESFSGLETVHQDYVTNLSSLRDHLVAKSLPPEELIRWLREKGLQHRTLRDSLRTIEEESRLLEGKFNPEESNEGQFYWNVHQYVKAVLTNFKKCTSYNELSFYRDYEQQLGALLQAIEIIQREKDQSKGISIADASKEVFYAADFVQDMNEVLIRIADKVLPEQWQAVVREYRRVRAAAGYPN